jgi:hypothetical protein
VQANTEPHDLTATTAWLRTQVFVRLMFNTLTTAATFTTATAIAIDTAAYTVNCYHTSCASELGRC